MFRFADGRIFEAPAAFVRESAVWKAFWDGRSLLPIVDVAHTLELMQCIVEVWEAKTDAEKERYCRGIFGPLWATYDAADDVLPPIFRLHSMVQFYEIAGCEFFVQRLAEIYRVMTPVFLKKHCQIVSIPSAEWLSEMGDSEANIRQFQRQTDIMNQKTFAVDSMRKTNLHIFEPILYIDTFLAAPKSEYRVDNWGMVESHRAEKAIQSGYQLNDEYILRYYSSQSALKLRNTDRFYSHRLFDLASSNFDNIEQSVRITWTTLLIYRPSDNRDPCLQIEIPYTAEAFEILRDVFMMALRRRQKSPSLMWTVVIVNWFNSTWYLWPSRCWLSKRDLFQHFISALSKVSFDKITFDNIFRRIEYAEWRSSGYLIHPDNLEFIESIPQILENVAVNGGQRPQTIDEFEKWHGFMYRQYEKKMSHCFYQPHATIDHLELVSRFWTKLLLHVEDDDIANTWLLSRYSQRGFLRAVQQLLFYGILSTKHPLIGYFAAMCPDELDVMLSLMFNVESRKVGLIQAFNVFYHPQVI